MNESRTKRRSGIQALLVDPYKQVKLGIIFLLVNLSFSLAIGAVFGYYIWDIYNAMIVYFKLTDQESMITLSKFAWPLAVGAFLLILFVCSTLYISIRYTHKFYGPLVSIHRFLDEVNKGIKPQPIILRDGDELQELAKKLNSAYLQD